MIKLFLIANSWDAVLDEETKPYCYSRSWYDTCKNIFYYKVNRYSIKDDSDLIGEFSYVVIRSHIFGNRIISMPFSDDGGIFLRDEIKIDDNKKREIVDGIIDLLDREAVQNNIDYAEIRGSNSLMSQGDRGKKLIARSAYIKFTIDTTCGYEAISRKYDTNIIKNMKKANKYVFVSECNSIEQFKELYYIYLVQMRSFGSPPLPIEYFTELFKGKLSKVLLAKINERVVAFLMVLVFGGKMYADINASISRYDNFFPKVKLFDESIKLACNSGIKLYDFMRTRYNSGVYWHKKKWGGFQEPIYYYYRIYKDRVNLVMDPEQKRYFLAKIIFKCMPLFLLRRVGVFVRVEAGK